MGRQMGMKEDELVKLGLAAALQNIGYIALSQDMLNEPTKLTAIELHEVQQHTQYGYLILKDNTALSADIVETIYQHHERWSGKGYPRGLKKDQINLHARIIAVADVYYALVSRRPHRQSNLPNEAIEFIMAYSGEHFDPEVVKLFTRLVPLYPAGIMVKLNTGELGIITDAKPGLIGRPNIRICYDKDYKQLTNPYDIDLAESQYQSKLVSEVVDY
jgi:HD-GYP domain-containing protein (c-di-GMP phosphodiesterase class II)